MIKAYLPSVALLLALLGFSLWNSHTMTERTTHWRTQLEEIATLAQSEDWASAEEALSNYYRSWSAHQTYLHIVTGHSAVDDAEAMYRRAQAFASARENSEFQAELSDLGDQLRLLAEMEHFSIKNVL